MREDEADAEDLVSRSDKKRARRVREDALSRLTQELVGVSDGTLSRLGLDEGLVDAVRDARLIKSARAKDRQLRVVRGLLRDGEWGAIASRLDTLLLHGRAPPKGLEPSPEEGQARQWAVRLMGEGAPALDELLLAHPAADRKYLRDLIRNATHGSPASRKRAEGKLAEVIRLLLR